MKDIIRYTDIVLIGTRYSIETTINIIIILFFMKSNYLPI